MSDAESKTTKYKFWTHPTAPPIPMAIITYDELPEQRIVAVLKNNASATLREAKIMVEALNATRV